MLSNIVVSVCMITYNHEDYLQEAIEGVLKQKTDFKFELIIGEDCSTDKTRSICLSFKEKYPDIITLLLYQQNQGMINNLISVIQKSQGEYIAFCEGDDYWTDPFKLQKQVELLRKYPNCGLVYTNVIVYEQAKQNYLSWPLDNKEPSFRELILENNIPTLSTCCRADLVHGFINTFRNEMSAWPFADLPMWLYISNFSSVKYISDITGVYRILTDSASHFSSEVKSNLFQQNSVKAILLIKKRLKLYFSEFSPVEDELQFIKKYYSWMISFRDYAFVLKVFTYLCKHNEFKLIFWAILYLPFWGIEFLPIKIQKVKKRTMR